MEFCHKKLSEQDGIREQGGIFQKKLKSKQDGILLQKIRSDISVGAPPPTLSSEWLLCAHRYPLKPVKVRMGLKVIKNCQHNYAKTINMESKNPKKVQSSYK